MASKRLVDPMVEAIHQGRCPDCQAPMSWPGERGWHVCPRCRCAWKVSEVADQLFPSFVRAEFARELATAARTEVLP